MLHRFSYLLPSLKKKCRTLNFVFTSLVSCEIAPSVPGVTLLHSYIKYWYWSKFYFHSATAVSGFQIISWILYLDVRTKLVERWSVYKVKWVFLVTFKTCWSIRMVWQVECLVPTAVLDSNYNTAAELTWPRPLKQMRTRQVGSESSERWWTLQNQTWDRTDTNCHL